MQHLDAGATVNLRRRAHRPPQSLGTALRSRFDVQRHVAGLRCCVRAPRVPRTVRGHAGARGRVIIRARALDHNRLVAVATSRVA
jgi:hypothetical protein